MSGAQAKKIETGAAAIAAIALGCAVGFAVLELLEPRAALPLRSAVASCGGAATCLIGWLLLARLGSPASDYRVAFFELSMLEPASTEGPLELTEVHQSPLILDDVLHAVGPEARVVRLFDSSAMPSSAELKARVDRYLGQGASWAKSPDASQALVDALTELRRSLR